MRPGTNITYRAGCAGESNLAGEKTTSRLGTPAQVYLGDLPAPEKTARRKAMNLDSKARA